MGQTVQAENRHRRQELERLKQKAIEAKQVFEKPRIKLGFDCLVLYLFVALICCYFELMYAYTFLSFCAFSVVFIMLHAVVVMQTNAHRVLSDVSNVAID